MVLCDGGPPTREWLDAPDQDIDPRAQLAMEIKLTETCGADATDLLAASQASEADAEGQAEEGFYASEAPVHFADRGQVPGLRRTGQQRRREPLPVHQLPVESAGRQT